MMNNLKQAVAAFCSLLLLTHAVGCSDVIVKVEKKPKNVDLSGAEGLQSLDLASSENFLKQLDGLKVVAADTLIKEMSARNYRSEIRSQIRSYRSYLIDHATKKVATMEPFYEVSALDCRATGLSFNMDKANSLLGIILKTVVLAKLSEVTAGNLNPGLSKDIAAIAQLVVKELGLKVDGKVDVVKDGDMTTTAGKFSLMLTEISGEQIDAATKKRDAVEVLNMDFTRQLGRHEIGTFVAAISVSHENKAGMLETLVGQLSVERADVKGRFVHSIKFTLGVEGAAASYGRSLVFEQVENSKTQLKMTHIFAPDTKNEHKVVTLLDLEAGTECKVKGEQDKLQPVPGTSPTIPKIPAVTPPGPTPSPMPSQLPSDDDGTSEPQPPNPTQKPGQNPGQHGK